MKSDKNERTNTEKFGYTIGCRLRRLANALKPESEKPSRSKRGATPHTPCNTSTKDYSHMFGTEDKILGMISWDDICSNYHDFVQQNPEYKTENSLFLLEDISRTRSDASYRLEQVFLDDKGEIISDGSDVPAVIVLAKKIDDKLKQLIGDKLELRRKLHN